MQAYILPYYTSFAKKNAIASHLPCQGDDDATCKFFSTKTIAECSIEKMNNSLCVRIETLQQRDNSE